MKVEGMVTTLWVEPMGSQVLPEPALAGSHGCSSQTKWHSVDLVIVWFALDIVGPL